MWDLAYKRIQTYMSRGKCLAESSPGEDVLDPQWRPATPHEAPPALGLLALYNSGSRARWYWPCQHCGQFFEARPGVEAFALPPFEELEKLVTQRDLMALADQFARVPCTHCGAEHTMDQKPVLNAAGRWVHEGETIQPDGTITGERRRTNIASYWQGGVSATYQRWDSMLLGYLQAVLTYVRTGDEQPMKTRLNVDFSAPHTPRALAKRRTAEAFVERLEDWPAGVVPEGVRFLTAAVDVQAHRFVVEVWGWGVGLERWLVSRFDITASRRPEGDRFAAIDPASYVEDWEVLIDEVVLREYALDGSPETRLAPVITLCDSGGKEGVTTNAYQFWRSLRGRELGGRLRLVKGDGRINTPRVQETWPDSRARRDRVAGGRGDVPVFLLNTNVLKDAVAGDLARTEPGPGYVHLPKWLDNSYFDELTAENRGKKGWDRIKAGAANEAFDLNVYNRAAVIILGAEQIDWSQPPEWAAEPQRSVAAPARPQETLADIASMLNG